MSDGGAASSPDHALRRSRHFSSCAPMTENQTFLFPRSNRGSDQGRPSSAVVKVPRSRDRPVLSYTAGMAMGTSCGRTKQAANVRLAVNRFVLVLTRWFAAGRRTRASWPILPCVGRETGRRRPMTLDSIQGFRLRVLTDATRSGNVTARARGLGSRAPTYGPALNAIGLHPKRRLARRGRPAWCLWWSSAQVVARRWRAVGQRTRAMACGSPRSRRGGSCVVTMLNTAGARLAVLEQHSAATRGILTERTRRRRQPVRHVQASRPRAGVDGFVDVGKLKGREGPGS